MTQNYLNGCSETIKEMWSFPYIYLYILCYTLRKSNVFPVKLLSNIKCCNGQGDSSQMLNPKMSKWQLSNIKLLGVNVTLCHRKNMKKER